MENAEILLQNIDKIHTTEMGYDRIRKNLSLNDTVDAVEWCKAAIMNNTNTVIRNDKNWYVTLGDNLITVNAYSYTIITAHKVRT